MFQVGQHVVCVDAEPEDGDPLADMGGLTKGRVYTVRSISPGHYWSGEYYPAGDLFLVEIVRSAEPGWEHEGEAPFFAHRFRPLSSDRLSIFRQHLAPLSTDKVEA